MKMRIMRALAVCAKKLVLPFCAAGADPYARLRRLVLSCPLALLLAACGGGGAPAAPAPAPALAAVVNLDGGDADDAPHDALSAPVDDDDPVLDDEAEGAARTGASPADFVLSGYAPAWPLTAAPGALAGQAAGLAAPAGASRLYVSTRGSDKDPGTAERPFRTIVRASRAAKPGTTIYVAPGTYADGIKTTASGTPHARIFYVSTTRGGARIVPPARSVNKAAWDNRGSYVDIVGFEVDGSRYQSGTPWRNGIYNGGSHAVVRHNHVHHIALNVGCTRAGGSGIGVDSYFHGVQSDVIGNRVHDIGPAGCRFIQGIYMSTSGSIKNNVVYRVAEGGIHLWHDANNVIITNNTVTASNTGIIIGGGNFYHSRGPNDHTAVYSNIVYDNRMGISEQGATGRNNSYRNNLVFQNSRYNWQLRNGLTHTGTVSSPPLFAGAHRSATPDLKLSSASPAIGRGTASHAADTDFDGRARNAGTGYDIGAYQH